MKVNNNSVLITGGSSGIGFAIAKKFIELGNKVIIVARDKNKLQNASEELNNCAIIQCDISKQDQLEQLSVKIQNHHQDINVLINNAGIQHNYFLQNETNPFLKIDDEIAINLVAPIKLSVLMLPYLCTKEEAAIVNLTSGLAFAPKENAAVYCATKAALRSFTQTLRYQLENNPVKVVELIPPLVETKMTDGRGKNKILPHLVADELIKGLKKNKDEINIGRIKVLRSIFRIAPSVAKKILRG